jgi:hypothetical protein
MKKRKAAVGNGGPNGSGANAKSGDWFDDVKDLMEVMRPLALTDSFPVDPERSVEDMTVRPADHTGNADRG